MAKINNRRHAERILLKDEEFGRSHAMLKHVSVSNEKLIKRCKGKKVGTRMTSFFSFENMASALKYANNDGNAKIVHMKKRGYREIFSENLPKNLRSLTIKVAEVFEGGHVECYYAKLRVIVVAKDNKSIITVFPQVNKI